MPACKVCGSWFVKIKPHEELCDKFECALCRLSGYVAPVVHGRWVDKPLIKSFKHTNIPVVECSACGIDFCDIINNHYFMYKYCPNCGAKMDGGED